MFDALVKVLTERFVPLFQPRLLEVYVQSFEKNEDVNARRVMIRIFKSWKEYFPRNILDPISVRLKIPFFEKQLFHEADPAQLNEFYEKGYISTCKSEEPTQTKMSTQAQVYSHLAQEPNFDLFKANGGSLDFTKGVEHLYQSNSNLNNYQGAFANSGLAVNNSPSTTEFLDAILTQSINQSQYS